MSGRAMLPMSKSTYHVLEQLFLAHDCIGTIQISTAAETRGGVIMHHEIAIWTPSDRWTVVATFWEEEREEALAAHALLVEQIGALM